VDACAAEYQQFYVPELEARRQERERLELRRQKVWTCIWEGSRCGLVCMVAQEAKGAGIGL
jgi:hypothetical protein